MEPWKPIGQGAHNQVWSDGRNVRRTHSNPAVHRLLLHLEQAGVKQVPRLVSADADTEILSFLPGKAALRPWPAAVHETTWMEDVGRWLRSLHDATETFALGPGAQFCWGPPAGAVVCHGDLGPWNCIVENERFAGVIDWDFARFGRRLDDLAEVALEMAPMRPIPGLSVAPQRARARVRALCAAYGGALEAGDVLQRMIPMLTERRDEHIVRARRGEPIWVEAERQGASADLSRYIRYLKANRFGD